MAEAPLILAGDVGGTKAILALFPPGGPPAKPARQAILAPRDHADFPALLRAFLGADAAAVRAASVAVAGPVRGNCCPAVNLPWPADGDAAAAALGLSGLALLNDLEATAMAIPALGPEDIAVLQAGRPDPAGARAVIAAGTGLGMAMVAPGGAVLPMEGGHTTFPARGPEEAALREFLARRHSTVSRERVVSGPGLAAIHAFLSERAGRPRREADGDPAAVSAAARRGDDPLAVRALDLFLAAYGASAGDLALLTLPWGGLYVAGGIAPKVLSRLLDGPFLPAFLDKGRARGILADVPVRVVLDEHAAVTGAALHAAARAGGAA